LFIRFSRSDDLSGFASCSGDQVFVVAFGLVDFLFFFFPGSDDVMEGFADFVRGIHHLKLNFCDGDAALVGIHQRL